MYQDDRSIDTGRRVRALALAFALVLLAADASMAARLVDVRVGSHPDYARVVLETDAPAVHEIVTLPAAASGEVVVRIAATSVARMVSIGPVDTCPVYPRRCWNRRGADRGQALGAGAGRSWASQADSKP